jgi:hypothetical protein
MPDIAMCSGEGCPQKDKCHRHTAKASDYQSFFMNPPMKEDETCEYFWDNKDYKDEQQNSNARTVGMDKKDITNGLGHTNDD